MKIALLRFPFGWLLGMIDEHSAAYLAGDGSDFVRAWNLDDDADPAPVAVLSYPAEVQPAVQAVPGKLEGQVAMVGQCFPVWLQVPTLRVNLEQTVAAEVFDVPSGMPVNGDAAPSPLIRAYVNSMFAAGVTIQESGVTRVRLA